jgi:hypothetical protein
MFWHDGVYGPAHESELRAFAFRLGIHSDAKGMASSVMQQMWQHIDTLRAQLAAANAEVERLLEEAASERACRIIAEGSERRLLAGLAGANAEMERLKSTPEMSDLERHWDKTTKSADGWAGPAPRALSNEEAHIFVEGMLVIAKRNGWLAQDKSVFDWVAGHLAELARLREVPGDLVEVARNLVAKWEHGSEEHRQWLRDTSVPDVAAALHAIRAQEREQLKHLIDARMNNHLCEMKEGYDDSITGFNEAWDLVRAAIRRGDAL